MMKHPLLIWWIATSVVALHAQGNTQVILVGVLQTDRTFHRGEELFLETRVTRDQIVYTYDSNATHFVVKEYISESGFNIWDGERTVKEKHRIRTPRFSK